MQKVVFLLLAMMCSADMFALQDHYSEVVARLLQHNGGQALFWGLIADCHRCGLYLDFGEHEI